MDGMNGTELHEQMAEQWAARDLADAAAMRAHSRQHRNACLYLRYVWRVDENTDAEAGAEWRLNEAAMLEDENATLTAQLVDYAVVKERLALERILLDDARREITALREERDTLCAKLDAANARIAALENAEVLAAPDEDAEMTPGAVRLDRASERPHYNIAPPRRTPPAA